MGTDVSLVSAGGIGLGAYQAGAYARLRESDLHVSRIAGSSIGAVNAARIAGGDPESRSGASKTSGPVDPCGTGPACRCKIPIFRTG
jgi:hypothetical protein